jgi:hypothetical protein
MVSATEDSVTLILAAIVGDAAVMCADTRVSGPPGTVPLTATKMSLKGGCVVGTYSYGNTVPVGVHKQIGALSDFLSGPTQVADAICKLFWPLGPGPPDIGALVVGFESGSGRILRVHGGNPTEGASHEVHASGDVSLSSDLMPVPTVDAMLQKMLVVQHTTAAANPGVGPPYECVVLRRAT